MAWWWWFLVGVWMYTTDFMPIWPLAFKICWVHIKKTNTDGWKWSDNFLGGIKYHKREYIFIVPKSYPGLILTKKDCVLLPYSIILFVFQLRHTSLVRSTGQVDLQVCPTLWIQVHVSVWLLCGHLKKPTRRTINNRAILWTLLKGKQQIFSPKTDRFVTRLRFFFCKRKVVKSSNTGTNLATLGLFWVLPKCCCCQVSSTSVMMVLRVPHQIPYFRNHWVDSR